MVCIVRGAEGMELLWIADSEIDVTLLGNKSELYICMHVAWHSFMAADCNWCALEKDDAIVSGRLLCYTVLSIIETRDSRKSGEADNTSKISTGNELWFTEECILDFIQQ